MAILERTEMAIAIGSESGTQSDQAHNNTIKTLKDSWMSVYVGLTTTIVLFFISLLLSDAGMIFQGDWSSHTLLFLEGIFIFLFFMSIMVLLIGMGSVIFCNRKLRRIQKKSFESR